MNPIFFSQWIRHSRCLSRRSATPSGFVLPVVIMVGLVLLVIGAAILARSQRDQQNSQSQTVTAAGLSIAEAGATRIQDLLNRYRYLALFPDCVARNSDGQCADPTVTTSPKPQSWANVSQVNILGMCNTTTSTTEVTAIATNQNWIPVNSSNPNQGEYRLIRYQFGPTIGQGPGTGILTVEGRVNGSQSANQGGTQLQLTIPIESQVLTQGVPGVWITLGGTGNNTIQGDVLLGDCNTAPTSISVTGTDPLTGKPYSAKYTSMVFPPLPPQPSPPPNTLTDPGGTITLPRSGDVFTSSKTVTLSNGKTKTIEGYEYLVNTIDFKSGTNLITITPGQKVIFYLQGDINVNANSDIVHTCVGNSSCKPTDFQIFGYGQATTTPAKRPEICLSGNNMLEAFVHAPEYTVGIGGTGGGAGGIKGTIWAYNWSNSGGCGSSTSNIVVVQQARWDDIGLQPGNTPPVLKGIASWQRQSR
ncbi:MAG: hypothetical protein ACKN9E_16775 [Microcystaceae cyanobacterium]